jgi:hypothetical protein
MIREDIFGRPSSFVGGDYIDIFIYVGVKIGKWVDMQGGGAWFAHQLTQPLRKLFLQAIGEVGLRTEKDDSSLRNLYK